MSPASQPKRSLKTVVVAVEPISERSTAFDVYAGTIRRFQEQNLLPPSRIVSIIHSSLYMVPLSWYSENEERYANEARSKIERACSGQFSIKTVHVLKGKAPTNEYLVERMSEYLKAIASDLLVVLSNNRTGLPYWFLGSFAETAAFTATSPVMVIKPQAKELEFSPKPRFVVALDAAASYSSKVSKWISNLALPANASVHFVCVKPEPRRILSSLRKPDHPKLAIQDLKSFEKTVADCGLSTSLSLIKEKDSIAQTLVDFADKKKAWALITISADRKLARKLLLGSTTRKALSLTKRPLMNIRFK